MESNDFTTHNTLVVMHSLLYESSTGCDLGYTAYFCYVFNFKTKIKGIIKPWLFDCSQI